MSYIFTNRSRRWTPERHVLDYPVHTRLNMGSAVRAVPCQPAGVLGSALANQHYAPYGLHTRDPLAAVLSQTRLVIARRTDHHLPNVLADNELGDDPPRCTGRRHPLSKLAFTTALFTPLSNLMSICDLCAVDNGLSDRTLRVRGLGRVWRHYINKRAMRRWGCGT